jgi:hypothetical protein
MRTARRTRNWKTGGYGHDHETWLQKGLRKVGAEIAQLRTLARKIFVQNFSSAVRMRCFRSSIITGEGNLGSSLRFIDEKTISGITSSVVATQGKIHEADFCEQSWLAFSGTAKESF